jgi:chromosome segregation ATPase
MSEKSTSHYVRKLADRIETMTVTQGDREVDEARSEVCRLLSQKEALNARLKAVKSEIKGQSDALDRRIATAHYTAETRQASVDVAVQDWLTKTNEVVTIRPDTGEILPGSRTATAAEMQEPIELEDDDGFGSGSH